MHHAFLPQGRTIDKEVMHPNVSCASETHRIAEKPFIILHHDNIPAHILMHVREFLVKNKTVIMPQPPYSPDLAPADFLLFAKLKTPIKGKRFATIEEIEKRRFRSV